MRVSLNQRAHVAPRRELEMYALWKFDAQRQLRFAVSNMTGQDFINENTYEDARFGSHTRSFTFPQGVRYRATYELKVWAALRSKGARPSCPAFSCT